MGLTTVTSEDIDALVGPARDGSGADAAEALYRFLNKVRPGWDRCPECSAEIVSGACTGCDYDTY